MEIEMTKSVNVQLEADGVEVTWGGNRDDSVIVSKGQEGIELTTDQMWALSHLLWEMGRQMNHQGVYQKARGK